MADVVMSVSETQWTSGKQLVVEVNGYRTNPNDLITWARIDLVEQVVAGTLELGARVPDSVTVYASLFQLEQLGKHLLAGVEALRKELANRSDAQTDLAGVTRNPIV